MVLLLSGALGLLGVIAPLHLREVAQTRPLTGFRPGLAPPAFLHAGGALKASQICAAPMSADDEPATLSEITDSLIHDYDALVARSNCSTLRTNSAL